MRAPFGPLLPVLAGAAAAAAIVTGPDYVLSVPLGGLAVVAAGLTLAEAILRARSAPRSGAAAGPSPGPGVARTWRMRGRLGRQELVLYLDRLDRAGNHPLLPVRPPAEVDRLARLPDEEFRTYVEARLTAIEGGS